MTHPVEPEVTYSFSPLAFSVKYRLKSKKKLCISVSNDYLVSFALRRVDTCEVPVRKTRGSAYLLSRSVLDTVDHVVELVPHSLSCDTSSGRTEVLFVEG